MITPPDDEVCQHGTAMDVHCCHCHSGFIFDMHHECPEECSVHHTPLDIDAIRGMICPVCDAETDAAVWPYIRAIILIGLTIAAVLLWMTPHA